VVGAILAAVLPCPASFKRVRELCTPRHLLILDEGMCGMGLTGTLHACDHEGFSPT